jgi:hypothetical protein
MGMAFGEARSKGYSVTVAVGWAFFVFLCWLSVVPVINVIYNRIFPKLPLFLQRPTYRAWKATLIKEIENQKVHPLVGLPMLLFIKIQLDQEFERGGLVAAQQSLENWVKEFLQSLEISHDG